MMLSITTEENLYIGMLPPLKFPSRDFPTKVCGNSYIIHISTSVAVTALLEYLNLAV